MLWCGAASRRRIPAFRTPGAGRPTAQPARSRHLAPDPDPLTFNMSVLMTLEPALSDAQRSRMGLPLAQWPAGTTTAHAATPVILSAAKNPTRSGVRFRPNILAGSNSTGQHSRPPHHHLAPGANAHIIRTTSQQPIRVATMCPRWSRAEAHFSSGEHRHETVPGGSNL
jgi:hypothetical protein